MDTEKKKVVKECMVIIRKEDGSAKSIWCDELFLDEFSFSFKNAHGTLLTYPLNRLIKISQKEKSDGEVDG